jgi:hypothetical protein
MPNNYILNIPTTGATTQTQISLSPSETVIIVGANGSGKTRLGVLLEGQIPIKSVQRIAAQKSLALNDNLPVISLERAEKILRFGLDHVTPEHYKINSRWGGKPATHFLTDFDALLQTLFGEHHRTASKFLRDSKAHQGNTVPTTQLEHLISTWADLLPHRILQIDDTSVRVRPSNVDGQQYAGAEMSDGERAIFYFLGQSLLAPQEGVVIVDEPEGHIHRAILSPLWDAIEKARPDCCFVYITHDFEFAASHTSSQKYFLKAYAHSPVSWEIEKIPQNTGLPEPVVVELLGSRKPILFVEGEVGSLDLTIYRSVYSSFNIIPIGSCQQVIHSVTSYKNSPVLHWLDVYGLIDADHLDASDIAYLQARKIFSLPVAEVENIFLLPSVFIKLANALACPYPDALFTQLKAKILEQATAHIDLICARYTVRQIDRRMKKVEINARDLRTLETEFQSQISNINPTDLFTSLKTELSSEIAQQNIPRVLELYDNKGLFSIAASLLGVRDQRILLEKIGRLLGGDSGNALKSELLLMLPSLTGNVGRVAPT